VFSVFFCGRKEETVKKNGKLIVDSPARKGAISLLKLRVV
jgi:hypothetical protein